MIDRAKILLQLCNYTLLGTEVDSNAIASLSEEDWNWLIHYATRQKVTPFILPYLEEYKPNHISKGLLSSVVAFSFKQKERFAIRQDVMCEMVKMFTEEGLDVMFMKGATLSKYYSEPKYRMCSDVDYYLYGESKKGDEILRQHGYETEDYFHHHTQSSINGVLIENHYDFLNRKDHKSNRILDDKLKMLAKTEGKSVPFIFNDGQTLSGAYGITPTMNAIFLIKHAAGHFASETVSFRQLYDIALFLKNEGDKVNWNLVCLSYEEGGVMNFVKILKYIFIKKMGVDIPDNYFPVDDPKDNNMADRVWDSIIHPADSNKYTPDSWRYLVYEARTLFNNKWKHELVYPNESYICLIASYGWSYIKQGLK